MRLGYRQSWCGLAVLVGGLTGCGFDADYGGTRLRCPGNAPCPDGFTCIADVCTTDPPEPDGGGPDAAGPDAGVCELAAMVADNDDCGLAIDLTAGALAAGGTTAYGDTTGYANNLTPSTLPGCTGAPEPGPDAVYALDLVPGDDLTARLTTQGFTGAIYLLDGCSLQAACKTGATGFDQLTFAVTAADTYYLIVDAPTSTAQGCYTLTATVMR